MKSRSASSNRLVVALLGVLAGFQASGQVFITAGFWQFPEGTSDARISIRVLNGGDGLELTGVNLNLQVAHNVAAGGSGPLPTITTVNLLATGAVFAINHGAVGGQGAITPQLFETTTRTIDGSIVNLGNGDQLLASAVFDLSGLAVGTVYDLHLDTENGPSSLLNELGQSIGLTLVSGQISIAAVPENAELGIAAAFALASVGGWRWLRKTRAQSARSTGSQAP